MRIICWSSDVCSSDLETDEAVEPRLEHAVNGPELAVPGREVLLQPQGQERPHAKIDDAEILPRHHDLLVEPTLIFWRHPDLVAEIAGIGHPVNDRRHEIGRAHV